MLHPEFHNISRRLQAEMVRFAGRDFNDPSDLRAVDDALEDVFTELKNDGIVDAYDRKIFEPDINLDDPPLHIEFNLFYPAGPIGNDNGIIQITQNSAYVYVFYMNEDGDPQHDDDVVPNIGKSQQSTAIDPDDAWDRAMGTL